MSCSRNSDAKCALPSFLFFPRGARPLPARSRFFVQPILLFPLHPLSFVAWAVWARRWLIICCVPTLERIRYTPQCTGQPKHHKRHSKSYKWKHEAGCAPVGLKKPSCAIPHTYNGGKKKRDCSDPKGCPTEFIDESAQFEKQHHLAWLSFEYARFGTQGTQFPNRRPN